MNEVLRNDSIFDVISNFAILNCYLFMVTEVYFRHKATKN